MDLHRTDECSRRLAEIPAGASLLIMKTPDPRMFKSGRDFAAWIGLTPTDHLTAGKVTLGVITRAGDEMLRRVFSGGCHCSSSARQSPFGKSRGWGVPAMYADWSQQALPGFASLVSKGVLPVGHLDLPSFCPERLAIAEQIAFGGYAHLNHPAGLYRYASGEAFETSCCFSAVDQLRRRPVPLTISSDEWTCGYPRCLHRGHEINHDNRLHLLINKAGLAGGVPISSPITNYQPEWKSVYFERNY